MLPTLLKELSGRAMEVTGLEVTVQAPESEHQVAEKSAKISQDAASTLAKLSEQLPDSELKTALARIVFQHRR
jgi:Tfp pilus assembly protein PilN